MKCFFCEQNGSGRTNIITENDAGYARWDDFAVSRGHAEIAPKRHIESFFELNDLELVALYRLIKETRMIIEDAMHPDGYNIGINEWVAAGRTVHHLHIHIIPRYNGDMQNPVWGIRHVISGKGFYEK